jgi:hypothetical protein
MAKRFIGVDLAEHIQDDQFLAKSTIVNFVSVSLRLFVASRTVTVMMMSLLPEELTFGSSSVSRLSLPHLSSFWASDTRAV